MKEFLKDLKSLIFDLRFIIPLILVTFIGYGFTLTHFSIGIDDLTRPRYVGGNENIAQGRFSGTLLDLLFGFTEYTPFWEELVALIFMLIAGILAALCLKRVTKNALHQGVYTFFACFFVSFPLINEIFLYSGTGQNIAIGYSLTFLSLIIFERFFETKKYVLLLPCLLIWTFNISLYESFILVYSCAICGIFLLRHLIADGHLTCKNEEIKENFKERQKTKKIFTEIGWYVGILAVAVIAEFIISNIIIKIVGITESAASATVVTSFNLSSFLLNFYLYFICAAFKYLPITIFLICLLIGCIAIVVYTKKSRHGFYILYFAGMFFSIIALSVLQSGVVVYRMLQCMAIFCGIIAIIILQKALNSKKNRTKIIASVIAILLVFCQTMDLAKWFYVDFIRSEEEKRIMVSVGDELVNNYDLSKPVLFTGHYALSDKILDYRSIREGSFIYNVLHTPVHGILNQDGYCIFETNKSITLAQPSNGSVIIWGTYAFGEVNAELLRCFEYLGYDFIQGTPEQHEQALEIAKTMSPQKSSYEILDTEEFIIVKFG